METETNGESNINGEENATGNDNATPQEPRPMHEAELHWLNEDLVEKILKRSEDDCSIKVLDIIRNVATKKGDNYTSVIIRVHAIYISENSKDGGPLETTLIFKVALDEEGPHTDILHHSKYFETESLMLSNSLPQMNKYLGVREKLGAQQFFVQLEKPVFLVLEDLARLGYKMVPRKEGLNIDHSLVAIRSMAKLHAASVKLCEEEKIHPLLYTRGMFHKHLEPAFKKYGNFFNENVKRLAKEMAKWDIDQEYTEKVKNISSKIFSLGLEASKFVEEDFNVITHGDCWINNMLFRYDEDQRPVRQAFVDFQMAKYGSPVIDILYFFGTSLSDDIFSDCRNLLLKEYYRQLCTTMKDIECSTEPPTFIQLQQSYQERAVLLMISTFTLLPLILVEEENVLTVNEMIEETNKYMDKAMVGMRTERFQEIIKSRLPLYDSMGFFDLE